MNVIDSTRTAVANTLRSKTRTTLTVIAIFIGAFTLALTSAVGTGVNSYINTTLSSIGATDVMTVIKPVPDTSTTEGGPEKYDPSTTAAEGSTFGGDQLAVTDADLASIEDIPGVLSIEPNLSVAADYVQFDGGAQYKAEVGALIPGMNLDLADGSAPDLASGSFEVALPTSYVGPLGYSSNAEALGSTITVQVSNGEGIASTVTATVVGITNPGLIGGGSIVPNQALHQELYDLQSVGLTAAEKSTYEDATVRFDPNATDDEIEALKTELTAAGYTGATLEDDIGLFRTILDAVVLVLNGFALIALLAAGFGIVNTLLMSVQERTREIGLMKAMGLAGGKIFGLFSLEAVVIGFLGSALGVGAAILAGLGLNAILGSGVLSALPGLTIIGFDPVALVVIVFAVMGIAFLAGTIPALRAARKDPIESLRYE